MQGRGRAAKLSGRLQEWIIWGLQPLLPPPHIPLKRKEYYCVFLAFPIPCCLLCCFVFLGILFLPYVLSPWAALFWGFLVPKRREKAKYPSGCIVLPGRFEEGGLSLCGQKLMGRKGERSRVVLVCAGASVEPKFLFSDFQGKELLAVKPSCLCVFLMF